MTLAFSSLKEFRQQFNQGLFQLLDKQQLGTFILCLANASNDAELFSQLKEPLFNQYQQLLNSIQHNLSSGKQFNVVEEDLLVFLKLHALGFNNIQLTQQRIESGWQCQFNQLRSFRPKRISAFAHNAQMSTPFVESQFNFNKPFMAKECFWSGEYNGQSLDIFYNKYPFADLHALLVPRRKECLAQYLTLDMHTYIWQFVSEFSRIFPGLAVAYNSYGAYASVNHLHFQMFINSTGLPISSSQWIHNGGKQQYPLKVFSSDDVKHSWQIIADLHAQNQPYNLIYMNSKMFIIPRKFQGSVDVPDWSSGFTWSELSGALLSFNQDIYRTISDDDIRRYLQAQSI